MRNRLLRRLDHLVDDVLWGGAVRIAHPEIDDVFAASTGSSLQFAGDVENVRGQPRQARKFFHDLSILKESREMQRYRRSVLSHKPWAGSCIAAT